MPRRKEPTREVSINISDENVRDALVLWVHKYHGIDLDIKQIELRFEEGKVTATAARKPHLDNPDKGVSDELCRIQSEPESP